MDTEIQPRKIEQPVERTAPLPASSLVPEKKEETIKDLAKAHTDKALKVITDILARDSATDSNRLEAARQILDRAWGKPTQFVNSQVEVVTYQALLNTIREKEHDYQDVIEAHAKVIEPDWGSLL